MFLKKNEYLAYLPKPSDLKNTNTNKSLSFTIIDCSQETNKTKTLSAKQKEFTFEARNIDEKKSWQTGIVMCMLATHNNQNNKNTLSKKYSISTEDNFKNAINTTTTRANTSSSMSLTFSSSFLSSFKLNQNNNNNNNASRGSMLRKTLTSNICFCFLNFFKFCKRRINFVLFFC